MHLRIKRSGMTKGQSFVELALVLPVLVLLMAGIVEIAFLYFSYMSALDLTREAARFASSRNFQQLDMPDPDEVCSDSFLHFYHDTSCIFTDPDFNASLVISSTDYADVAISVFTVTGNQITNRWPDNSDGVFSLYQTDIDGTMVPNWKLDCEGEIAHTEPYMTNDEVEARFQPNAPTEKGFVMVEVYYCYHHKLGLPFYDWAIPNPMRMHAYTIMSAPEAIPTPTPIASP